MFKRTHRLARQTEVKLAMLKGRSFFSPYFTVKYLNKPENKQTRFTVIVSTKVSKKAVARNRLKRVVRETLRQNIEDFRAGDYAFIVKPSAMKLEPKYLRESLKQFLSQTKLLRS